MSLKDDAEHAWDELRPSEQLEMVQSESYDRAVFIAGYLRACKEIAEQLVEVDPRIPEPPNLLEEMEHPLSIVRDNANHTISLVMDSTHYSQLQALLEGSDGD